MFERTDPNTLRNWLIVAAVAYFLLPHDLLPDFLGLPGRIDDALIMAWLAWFYRSHLRQYVATGFEQEASDPASGADSGRGSSTGSPRAFDAYHVLGVSRSASKDEIQVAYRSRMREYHPDKVAHLGEELRQLAHAKSQDIQRAYRQLNG